MLSVIKEVISFHYILVFGDTSSVKQKRCEKKNSK